MARIARVVVPEFPHHIMQRGNRGQKVFFNENGCSYYLRLIKTCSDRFKVDIICYCLMSNHIHFIARPLQNGDLSQAISETHLPYTRFINLREK